MNHSFNVAIAEKFGVNAAILFESIMFWCKKNEANGMNIHEGRAWTYNSIKAFAKLYPYMTENVIRYSLKKLVDAGMILTGNYSDDKRDRSLWYAIGDVANCICDDSKMDNGNSTDCICENSQMDFEKFSNGFENNPECITVINTDINDSSLSTTPTTTRTRGELDENDSTSNVFSDDYKDDGYTMSVEAYAENCLQFMTPQNRQELVSFMDDLTPDLIMHAIDETCAQGIRVWAYVRKVLNEYVNSGIKTVGEARAKEELHQQQSNNASGNYKRNGRASPPPIEEPINWSL